MDFTRGMRDKLSKYINPNNDIQIEMNIAGNSTYDFCCFGVDGTGKLSDDRYMIFYNQTSSPNKEITIDLGNNSAKFVLNLSKLPSTINKLVFTVSIDGNGTMGSILKHSFLLYQNGEPKIALNLVGSDFNQEKAIISVEIYLKDEWRLSAVANGFNGGLSALLANYGGTEISNTTTVPTPSPSTPIIEAKKPMPTIETPPAEKISLKKGQKVSLSKNNGAPIVIENGWTAKGKDYDLKALVRYRNGKLLYIGAANSDELLSTPDGAVRHGGDVKNPGDLEHIDITWHKDIASVAVSSYSAIENGTGSFHRYGVYVRIKNGTQIIEIPAENASADDRSYTLCFGEIIYGDSPNSFDVSALEMYSRPNSEHRIGYKGNKVVMDIGPKGCQK
ncbi:MAG: TerD family protein [Lachnospiraceae bacterium]|nr:TerD family protein [Lachnospiraceae bacterium]MBR4085634.1 TerD family protein [Lachnospiraceae bacterium]